MAHPAVPIIRATVGQCAQQSFPVFLAYRPKLSGNSTNPNSYALDRYLNKPRMLVLLRFDEDTYSLETCNRYKQAIEML